MKTLSKFRLGFLLLITLLPSHASAQNDQATNEPSPCTVSILALGQINPQRFTHPKDYLARFAGISKENDEVCREMIRTGKESPVPIPELPAELPPGPLMVLTNRKEQKALEFSLNLGGVSKRFPVERGGNLEIYLAHDRSSNASVTEGKKRKIHSIPIAQSCREMLVFFIKPATLNWTGYQVVPVDFSPEKVPERSVLLVNFSKMVLLVWPEIAENPTVENKSLILLKPGMRAVYKVPKDLSTLRLLYSDPTAPDEILCSVNCEAIPGHRSLAFTFGLRTPENGVSVASRSLLFPIDPPKLETLDGARKIE